MLKKGVAYSETSWQKITLPKARKCMWNKADKRH